MGRLRVLSGREVCQILQRHGFVEVRRADGTTTVAVPDHAEIKIGTLLPIVRQSGVPRSEIES